MRKLGLLGGLGPEATIVYYQNIIKAFTPKYEAVGYPEIIIHSVDLRRYARLADHGQWNELADEIGRLFESMRTAGAGFGAMTANTPHRVFDEIQQRTKLPLISIVETTRQAAQQEGLKRPLLLGTKTTMSSDFYRHSFRRQGMDIVVPDGADQDYVNDKIFSEIEHGIFKNATKQALLAIIAKHKSGIDGVILGCTELPLIIDEQDVDVCCLNTTQLHIDAIVRAIEGL